MSMKAFLVNRDISIDSELGGYVSLNFYKEGTIIDPAQYLKNRGHRVWIKNRPKLLKRMYQVKQELEVYHREGLSKRKRKSWVKPITPDMLDGINVMEFTGPTPPKQKKKKIKLDWKEDTGYSTKHPAQQAGICPESVCVWVWFGGVDPKDGYWKPFFTDLTIGTFIDRVNTEGRLAVSAQIKTAPLPPTSKSFATLGHTINPDKATKILVGRRLVTKQAKKVFVGGRFVTHEKKSFLVRG